MATLSCCGNQPTPIIIGLLVTYSIGLINCYPLYGSASPSSSLPSSASSAASSNGNANLGQIVYRPNYNLPSSSVSSSSPVSSSPPISIVAPSQSSQPSTSSSSSLPVTVSQSSSQLSPSTLNHHASLPGGLTLIRGNSISDDNSLRRPSSNSYHDYYDTFRLPLIASGRDKSDLGVANSGSGRLVLSGLPNGFGNGNKQRLIFAQPSTSPIDFDYVPYIQSDFNPASLSSALAAVSSGSERNGDLYEEADYNDPVYDLKYDPIQDANWLNEAISSSYRQTQQQQQPQLSALPSVPFIASPDNSGPLSSPNSDEYLSNLMLTFIVKELEKSAQQQQPPLSSQSSEPVQHSVKLQKQANVEGLKSYEGYGLEKKSFNRDKGTIKSGENQMESAKRIEQRGQKEFAMLRPAIESNGKDDIDSQSSLSSQLQSVSATLSTTTTTTTERSDEEVNQLRSLLQSA